MIDVDQMWGEWRTDVLLLVLIVALLAVIAYGRWWA